MENRSANQGKGSASMPLRASRLSNVVSTFYREHGDLNEPVGPLVITIVVYTLGLTFWFAHFFATLPFNLAETRSFWLGSFHGDLPLYDAISFVCILVGYLIFFDVLRFWINATRFSLANFVMYFSCVFVLGIIANTLYVMRTTFLDDEYFNYVSKAEASTGRRSYLGRVRNFYPERCGPAPPPCYLLELEDRSVVLAHVGERTTLFGRDEEPLTEIVVVDARVGAKTGIHMYFEVVYYIPGDTEWIWGRIVRSWERWHK